MKDRKEVRRSPEGWELKSLRHLGRFRKGLTITKADLLDDGIPCLNYGEVHSRYPFEVNQDVQPLRCVNPAYNETNPEASVSSGDFVFADTSEDFEGVGNFTLVTGESPLFAGYHTIIYSLSSEVDPRFLAYGLDSFPFRTQLRLSVKGIKVFSITQEILRGARVLLPSMDQQRSIAKLLDEETAVIDTLIAQKTRFIELLKEKRQAVITKAVTKGLDDSVEMKDSGVEWLGSVPYHWKVVPLKHLLEGALQYGATESGETFIEEWPRYIRITDIDSHGRLRSEGAKSLAPSIAEPYLIKKWDILFARSGATVGKSFVYEGEDYKACFAGYMIRASVNPSLICSEYLYFYLQSHSYWEYIVGSQSQATIQNVSAEKYGALFVPLPPIEEQSNLLTFLKKTTRRVDELISRTERSIELLKEKRSALITAAVTGKIDVREAA